MVSATVSVAFGGAASAVGKEVSSPGGYNFTNRLPQAQAGLDIYGQGMIVSNHLYQAPNLVSYWHAWFGNDDMSRRSDTTYIPSSTSLGVATANNLVYFSDYGYTGYVAVVEIQTAHYFYYLEFDTMYNKIALTYNTYGGYPYFSAPHWTTPLDVFNATISSNRLSMNIEQNKDGLLDIHVVGLPGPVPVVNIDWTLPW